MKIVVVGAGIAGAVTAMALARDGHRVTVLERAAAPATGASHANAGLVSPGHCFSWAEPGVAGMAVRSLLGLTDGIGISSPWDAAFWRWGTLFAREGTRERWLANSAAALALSAYSRDQQFGPDQLPLDCYGGRRGGILYLYGDGDSPGAHDAELLAAAGEPFERLDAAQILEREPFLRDAAVKFSQGVFSPRDATGDAARYALAALDEARRLGAELSFSEAVVGLPVQGDRVLGVDTAVRRYPADAVVITAGLASKRMLRPAGYDLPIHAVTGYSITYEGSRNTLPSVGAVSIPHKVAWAAFGDRTVRFTGFADIGRPGASRVASRFAALDAFAANVLPELRDAVPARWVGQRPMTPDNLPFLGAGKHSNLWLNCGHGAMGWTMASGSARIVADLVAGRAPTIDLAPYRWDRYRLLDRRA